MAYANPNWANATILTEDFESDWTTNLSGGGAAQGASASMKYLIVKPASDMEISDLGISLKANVESVVACSDVDQLPAGEFVLVPDPDQLRRSNVLTALIQGDQLPFKWAASESFDTNSNKPDAEKYYPESIQISDFEDRKISAQEISAGKVVGVASVESPSVVAAAITLDSEDLGGKLTSLENRAGAEEALSASSALDRQDIRDDFAAADVAAATAAANDATSKSNAAQAAAELTASGDATSKADAAQAAAILSASGDATTKSDAAQAAAISSAATTAQSKVDALESDLKANEIAANAAAAAAAQGDATSNAGNVSALTTRVTNEETKSADHESRVAALEGSSTSQASSLASLNTNFTAQQAASGANAQSITSLQTASTSQSSSLNTEIADRAAADANLQTQLDGNDTDIAALQGTVTAIMDGSSANLNAFKEVADAFQLADSNLNGAITALAAEHNTELDAEILRAGNAESALDSKIDALVDSDIGISLPAGSAIASLYGATATSVDDILQAESQNTYLAAGLIHGFGAPNGFDDYKATATALMGGVPPGPGSLMDKVESAEADILSNAGAVSTEKSRAEAAEAALAGDVSTLSSSHATDKAAHQAAIASNAADIVSEKAIAAGLVSTEQGRALAAEAANASDISAEEVRALAAENALSVAHAADKATADAARAANAAAVSSEETRALGIEAGLASDIAQEAVDRAAAIAALPISNYSYEGGVRGYASGMTMKTSADLPMNLNSKRFTGASTVHTYSVSCSQAVSASCEFSIKLVDGTNGSTKSEELVSLSAGESFKAGSISMSAAAGDRLIYKVSSGSVCQDPQISCDYNINP